jgi:hypothetical protein
MLSSVSQDLQLGRQVTLDHYYHLVCRLKDIVDVFCENVKKIVAHQADKRLKVLDDSGKDNGLSRHAVSFLGLRICEEVWALDIHKEEVEEWMFVTDVGLY